MLDLGASPGSWSVYAAERVGPRGSVRGIDLNPHNSALPEHAKIEVGDVYALKPEALGRYDVVLSDMAPKTSGQRHADQFNSYQLYMRALEIASVVLKDGGHFVGKIFDGAEFDDAKTATRAHFDKVRVIRPKATRDVSYELFIVGLGRRTTTESP